MSQKALTSQTAVAGQGDEHSHGGSLLGPVLCWAVVFADIGTSVYYVPGILYGNVGNLSGFFVFLTMSVFVLLTLKYAEVTSRYPQGGGVVTVAASALNKWFGALGGMFILVDYFLTSSISSASGMQYLSVVLPQLGATVHVPFVGSIQLIILLATIGVLILLGILNWIGVSESARVSLVGAVIAFGSDIAILITVFSHISLGDFFRLFHEMFTTNALTPTKLLVGFAGSFLAFSGLESISQLSPVMKVPRQRVAGIALFMVVITIGITSPLLTMFSTLLQPKEAADPILNTQLISLLGGHWGNVLLQTEVAISASALLVFASNTAIIGAYHVFMALARLGFFPSFVLERNKLRDTPHYSIMLATGIPIIVLLIVLGNINILGDMYAFGLLGAFSLTCLGMDIVRWRERRPGRSRRSRRRSSSIQQSAVDDELELLDTRITQPDVAAAEQNGMYRRAETRVDGALSPFIQTIRGWWHTLDFWLGVITTGLVIIAWSTNLVAKPLATLFGGTVTVIGMVVAFFNYRQQKQRGQVLVHVSPLSSVENMPDALLAVLLPGQEKSNLAIAQAALNTMDGNPLAILYIGEPKPPQTVQPFEYYEPYLYDETAKETFRQVDRLVQERKPKQPPQYLYRSLPQLSEPQEAEVVSRVWQTMRPHELLIAAEDVLMLQDINPDRIRYELTPSGKVAHLVSKW